MNRKGRRRPALRRIHPAASCLLVALCCSCWRSCWEKSRAKNYAVVLGFSPASLSWCTTRTAANAAVRGQRSGGIGSSAVERQPIPSFSREAQGRPTASYVPLVLRASSSSATTAEDFTGDPPKVVQVSTGDQPPAELKSESHDHQQQQQQQQQNVEDPAPLETIQPSAAAVSQPASKKPSLPVVMWRFSRPHTLIGSALAVPALHLLAAPTLASIRGWPIVASVLYATVPSLLMNLYITGLNQITDVEIDKINKPDLPIAAGILSKRSAVVAVLVSLAASLGMGHFAPAPYSTPGLLFALWGSAVLGTMYSLPPFRLKRFPLLAAFCIVAVRGTIINASFFAHAKAAVFGGPSSVFAALATDPKCTLSSLFFCVFGVVIALMKDVPDVKGDLTSNVRTFSVRLGQRQVFDGARRLLTGLFGAFGIGFASGCLMAPSATLAVCRGLTATAALWAGFSIRQRSLAVDPEDSQQVYTFYMFLWKLFYLSYFALPFSR